jgi:hypothetical protein
MKQALMKRAVSGDVQEGLGLYYIIPELKVSCSEYE